MTSWVEVSEERLAGNFRVIAEAAGAETEVLAVVKANAYGHGAEACSVALARAGAKWLGVANASEGVRVRTALEAAGFARGAHGTSEILVLCGLTAEDVAAIRESGLTPIVWTLEQVELLRGSGVAVHVEVETGMGRQGVKPGAAFDELLDAIAAAGLRLDGVCTHFSAADVAGSELTQAQERRFESAVAQVGAKGLTPKWVHAGSSSSVDNPAQDWPWLVWLAKTVGARAMVRSGIALYGYCLRIDEGPKGEEEAGLTEAHLRRALKPVMTWKTRIIGVRDAEAGDTVGYNATFTVPKPMRLALLPVGYADGLRRELSGTIAKPGGWVVFRGLGGECKRAPIVGRVSMNLTTVDVTAIEGVRVGDEVVLLGDGVTADDHARLAKTIAYEILCGAGKNSC